MSYTLAEKTRATAYLDQPQRLDLPEATAQFGVFDSHRSWFCTNGQGIGIDLPHRRQLDHPGAMHAEHQGAADHIAQRAVGLNPVPCLTEQRRESASTGGGMLFDQFPNEGYVFLRDDT